ncbi:DUF1488 family protein [Methylobacterium oxalidis]|uniref:DUF1488 domain-containing protein n=1 Tax=Methylobacterium oxalidis TaxID=944322 RepID=A0A512J223_9HYPH|nr:DUF1488 family protein [Methylobacterium oxalidis]GEP04004.1 hypothetical protein MOX02_20420 [Methylobacterium oxalidis]GJE31534.1 hypothetical protein LDDCCGHA_1714 [Methylobacterium oxalidis]GLS64036.1 hypothetical protein GCM10007888_24170 [Methylobacterium oxalidis]
MPLSHNRFDDPHIDRATSEHVRFSMTDGQRIVAGRVPVAALRERFGDDASDPLALYGRCREAVEAAASRKFDRVGAPDAMVDLDPEDLAEDPA